MSTQNVPPSTFTSQASSGPAGGSGFRGRVRFGRLAFILLLAAAALAWLAPADATTRVLALRMFDAPGHTRVVFDLSAPVRYNMFSLRRPDRLVVDFNRAQFAAAIENSFRKNRRIARIRAASRGRARHRVVFDLVSPVPARSFVLGPQGHRGHRLVIDFGAKAEVSPRAVARISPVKKEAKRRAAKRLRDVVVALDAGHGGRDPGAVGRRHGTREKDVTLAIARKVAAELRRRPGVRPVLVRDGDYYLPLRRRSEIARRHGADLFVSIHADAFRDPACAARRSTCFPRAGRAAKRRSGSRHAKTRRTRGDGLTLGGREPMVKSTLVDMSQSGAIRLSTDAAGSVLRELKRKVHVHGNHVHRAGFVVLKTRNVPSLLVETAFLSNPSDERMLRSGAYQRKLARAVADGIYEYLKRQAPVGTLVEARNRMKLASR